MDLATEVEAQDEACYTSGSVAGIVIATIVVTLVTGGLAAAFIWYLWMQRKGTFGEKEEEKNGTFYVPRDVGTSPDKKLLSKELGDFAFDNPYFRDDDAAEKGESRFRMDNGNATPLQHAKTVNGTSGQHKKTRPFSSLPFHHVFYPSGKKQKGTVDDTYISKHLERITVPLRGKDFTGLGFNVCGNMRDGIFVKDVLHRGPATESGKIRAGDRIVSLTVSFEGMVYEDALTIISYASPYDVRVEIEKSSGRQPVAPSSPRRVGASTSFRGPSRLFHPLYRSQSIDDLTQIGKDSALDRNSPSSKEKDSAKEPTPKRSQSVEASNGGLKSRIAAFALKSGTEESGKPSRKSSTSSCDSGNKAPPAADEQIQACGKGEAAPISKKEAKSARFRVEQPLVKTEAPPARQAPPIKPARDPPAQEEKSSDAVDSTKPKSQAPVQPRMEISNPSTSEIGTEAETESKDRPSAPPRKISTPAKRRAPAPPPSLKTETSAVVHRADEKNDEEEEQDSLLNEQNKTIATSQDLSSEGISKVVTNIKDIATSELSSCEVHDTTAAIGDESVISSSPSQEESHIASPLSNVSAILPPPSSETLDLAPPPPLPLSPLPDLPDHDSPDYPVSDLHSFANTIDEKDLTSSSNSTLSSNTSSSSPSIDKDEPTSPGKRKASSLGDLTKLEQGARKSSTSSAILERAVSMDLQQGIPGENLEKQKKILRAPTFEDCCDEDTEIDGIEADISLKKWENTDAEPITNGEIKHIDENSNAEVMSSANKENDVSDEITLFKSTAENSSTISVTTETLDINMNSSTVNEDDSVMEKHLTSTPIRKVIDIRNATQSGECPVKEDVTDAQDSLTTDNSVKHSRTESSSIHVFSPVTISIPVIKPDFTHFEKLPSPPTNSDGSWKVTKISTTTSEDKIQPLERISVQSLYRPIFVNKESDELSDESMSPDDPSISVKLSESLFESNPTPTESLNFNDSITFVKLNESSTKTETESPIKYTETTTIVKLNESSISPEKLVNGNNSDSSDNYSTAQETTVSSVENNNNSTSTFSVTLSPTISGNVTLKTPNSVAGFAKTLIIPGPNEVENLLSLATEPNTPPPQLKNLATIEKE